MRDMQKQRVYRAEREFFSIHLTALETYGYSPRNIYIMTLEECDAFVKKVFHSKWRKKNLVAQRAEPPQVVAKHHGKATGSSTRIALPAWARTKFVVLHEMAHGLAPVSSRHNREWARIFVMLVDRWMSIEDGKMLRTAFKKHKVKYSQKKKISATAMIGLRERFKKLQEAQNLQDASANR